MLQCIYVRTENLACLICTVKNQPKIDIIENRQKSKTSKYDLEVKGGKHANMLEMMIQTRLFLNFILIK